MRVDGVLETCLYVDNLDLSESFYRRVLCLDPLARVAGRHVVFVCGEAMLLLFRAGETNQAGDVPPHGSHGQGHVAFSVAISDIGLWREHLEANGVAVEKEIVWERGAHSIYFRDPDGNSLELATRDLWRAS